MRGPKQSPLLSQESADHRSSTLDGMELGADPEHAVADVVRHIETTIGRDPAEWERWPGGWPDEIGTSLVDAVFSARAQYKSKHGRGIHPLIVAWRTATDGSTVSLQSLHEDLLRHGPDAWAKAFGNEQHSPSRPADAPGGPTKAAAVLQASSLLCAADPPIDSANDIHHRSVGDVKRLLRSVPGIGYATTNYFLMLLGLPGVKPDRMIHRFLQTATHRNWSDLHAEQLVTQAASLLDGVEAHQLEHSIWSYQSVLASP